MKWFLFGAVSFVLAACGGESTTPPPDPEDCTPVDCTPVQCTLPDDAQVVEPDMATGRYALTGTLDVDTCADLAGDELLDFGEFIVAMTTDEYLFMQADLVMSSSDGVTYSYTQSAESWYCSEETTTLTAVLEFTEYSLSGTITLDYIGLDCWVGSDDDGNPIYEDDECTRTWSVFGVRQ